MLGFGTWVPPAPSWSSLRASPRRPPDRQSPRALSGSTPESLSEELRALLGGGADVTTFDAWDSRGSEASELHKVGESVERGQARKWRNKTLLSSPEDALRLSEVDPERSPCKFLGGGGGSRFSLSRLGLAMGSSG